MNRLGTYWSVLGRLLTHAGETLRAQRLVIIGGFLALLLETVFRLFEPWPLQYLVDHLFVDIAQTGVPWGQVLACATLLVLIVGGRALCAYLWTVGFAIAGNRILLAIRARLFAHLQTLPTGFHNRSRAGDLLTRLVDDVGMVRDVVVTAAMPLAGSLVLMTVMLGVMAWLNWRLTIIVAAGYPLLWLILQRKKRRIHSAAQNQRAQVSQVAATAAEALASIKAVQALGLSDRLNAQFGRSNDGDLTSGVKVKRLSAAMERTVDVVIGVLTGAVLLAGTFELSAERLSLGELLVFLAYLRSTAKPVRNWAKYGARIAKSTAGAQRILEVLETSPGVTDGPSPQRPEPILGRIEFSNVTFKHDDGEPVFENANLTIEAGESIAIIGESGTGKSTALGLIMRLYDPDDGAIRLDGVDLSKIELAYLRQQYAIALQDPLLFHGSILSNIAQSVPEATPEQLHRAIEQAQVDRFTHALPAGLNTLVGEGGVNLSNGQRQRIALARALLKDAPVFIVDEPLNALDREVSTAVSDALCLHAHGRTTVIVTHDSNQALLADRVVTIANRGFHEVAKVELRATLTATPEVKHG